MPEPSSSSGRRYGTSGRDRIEEWLAATQDPVRRDAFLSWLRAAAWDPEAVTHGYIENVGRNRRINISDVPVAETRVNFLVVDVPARCIHILRISDTEYRYPLDG